MPHTVVLSIVTLAHALATSEERSASMVWLLSPSPFEK
jgi:hypothetical protein